MSEAKKCSSCGTEMRFWKSASLRLGGTQGLAKFLLGELDEIDEEMLLLDLYICPKYGRIELYYRLQEEGAKP